MYKGMKRALSILMAFTLLLGFMTIFQQKVEAKSDDRGGLTQWMKDNRPFNGGYYRVWNDMQSKNVPDWKNPQTRMDEITDEVDLVLAFYDNQLGYIDTEVMKGYVQTLHSRGKKVVGSMFVHLLYDDIIQYNKNLENEIKADFKEYVQYNYSAAREVLVFPKNEAGNQARADFFLKYYMDLYGFDGLDIDMEKSEQEIGNNMDHVHTMFNLLAKKVGPKNNSDKLFIYDTTFSAEHSAFRNNKDLFDLVLIQKYGHHSEYRLHYGKSHFDTFAKYIPTENILIGFSFYEENTYASKGNNAHTNRWYDIPMRDGRVEKLDNNELTGKFEAGEFKGSRAGRYAKWQPDYGLKGGIFSYAVERDGVPHPTREEAVRMFEEYSKNKIGANYDIEKWVKDGRPGKSPSDDLDSTTYAQTKELNTLLEEDNFYGAIDETVIKDPAFREQVISHVGNYRGSIERYTKELYLNDANIESLEGLKEFKRVKSIQLYGLNKIKSITPDLLPDHFKIAPEEVFNKPFDQKLIMTDLEGLEELDLSGLHLETLAIRNPENFKSLRKLNVSNNRLDLSKLSYERYVIEELTKIIKANLEKDGVEFTSDRVKFDNQSPRSYYPNFNPSYIRIAKGSEGVHIRSLLEGQKTIRGFFIKDEKEFNNYKTDKLQGVKYIQDELSYDKFAVKYDKFTATIKDVNGVVVDGEVIPTESEATYTVEYKDQAGKVVHILKVTVDKGSVATQNLALNAYTFGVYNNESTQNRIFDGKLGYQNSHISYGGKETVYFRIPEKSVVNKMEIVLGSDVTDFSLEYVKDLETISAPRENVEYAKKLEKWEVAITKDSLAKGTHTFELPEKANSSYWRMTIDLPKFGSLEELILWGSKKADAEVNEARAKAYEVLERHGLNSSFIEKLIERTSKRENIEQLVKDLLGSKLQQLVDVVEKDLGALAKGNLSKTLADAKAVLKKEFPQLDELDETLTGLLDESKKSIKESIEGSAYLTEGEKKSFLTELDMQLFSKGLADIFNKFKKLNDSRTPHTTKEVVLPKTVYVASDEVEFGKEEVVSEGSNGEKTVTRIDGAVVFEEETLEAEPKLIKVGNVEKTEKIINFGVERKYVNTRLKSEGDVEVVKGQNGVDTTTTVYEVDSATGKLSNPVSSTERTTPVINQVVEYGDAVQPEPQPKRGWEKLSDGRWIYRKADGSRLKSAWVGNYYLKADGIMADKEWIYDKQYQSWYYLKEGGAYARLQWQDKYYLLEDGKMAVSRWIYDKQYKGWYYLTKTGAYARNTVTPDGYTVDKSGKWDTSIPRK